MIWSTTTQFIVIGMAAFCISFGVIYSLIFCYKSRRKQNYSEENERLRDELLREKSISRRKSTSLTSPPLSDSVINPNYNASPYKVPTRHLRSTSATYSPTHYLSPHHRRNSTPTQPPGCTSVSTECSCCGAPRGITKSKSATATEHTITCTPLSSSSSSSPSSSHVDNIETPRNCCCKAKSLQANGNDTHMEEEEWGNESDDDFLSTHKCKLIPIVNNPKSMPKSTLTLDGKSCWEGSYDRHHPKCFSFGPIPVARKARTAPLPPASGVGASPQNINASIGMCQQKNNTTPCITFTAAPPTFNTTQTNLNINVKDCPDWEEKQPLLSKKLEKGKKEEKVESEKNDDNDKEKADDDILANRRGWANYNNNSANRKSYYTLDLFKKENMVLEEIPCFIDQNSMSCN